MNLPAASGRGSKDEKYLIIFHYILALNINSR